jgi:hypothetical protein
MNLAIEEYRNNYVLAKKLERIFSPINSEEKRILHNDLLNDIKNIVGLSMAADLEMRFRLAEIIIQLGAKYWQEKEDKRTGRQNWKRNRVGTGA